MMKISTILLELYNLDPMNSKCTNCGRSVKPVSLSSHKGANRKHDEEFKFGILNIEKNIIHVFCSKKCKECYRGEKLSTPDRGK